MPGTYSLIPHSKEEEVTSDFICKEDYTISIVVCDAVCLERNLNLAMQVLDVSPNTIICVNLMDEARKKGIIVDTNKLSKLLNIPVIGMSARSGEGLFELKETIAEAAKKSIKRNNSEICRNKEIDSEKYVKKSAKISAETVIFTKEDYDKKDRKLDKLLTSKFTGIPIMLLLLMVIFWITIVGANYPSTVLFDFFNNVGEKLLILLNKINAPNWLSSLIVSGAYKVLTWVVAVMLPPMAIFFPLFTLLEDLGYLPRIAFNLDKTFKKCCACGKQALTMCMGFGCNACGVTGCRIIDSPRERLIAILTNSFVPCNGRFPTLISIITMFFIGANVGAFSSFLSVLILVLVILVGIILTFVVSKILSKTLLKGEPSSFTLELPPYRTPQVGKVIIRSLLDRTLFVLGRAVAVALPAGILIWILANIEISGVSILAHCTNFLDPFAKLFGLDGVILMALILGFPANEIVMPIILMSYLSTGELVEISNVFELRNILVANGWTIITAICTMLIFLIHWPCSTTCLTIKKETGSLKWMFAAMAIPTIVGFTLCFIVATIGRIVV